MANIHLIHWQLEESRQLAEKLTDLGHTVNIQVPNGPQFFKDLQAKPPQIMVIDLSRLPSQGRDTGINLRTHKSTQMVTLIFVGGDPLKVAKIKEILPDAFYCKWDEIVTVLREAIHNPPAGKRIDNVFAGYSGKPLVNKLGFKKGMRVCLINSPGDFMRTLENLTDGVDLITELDSPCNFILWFVKFKSELNAMIPSLALICKEQHTRLWICWQKKSAGVESEVTQPMVRQAGLDHGLVDYKICAIDATWSGLLFTWRG
jgi:hypothetical protein